MQTNANNKNSAKRFIKNKAQVTLEMGATIRARQVINNGEKHKRK